MARGERGNLDSPFFLDEEDVGEEGAAKSEPFEVSADLIATGRTCVIGSSGCIPESEYFYTKKGVVQVSEIYEGMPSHNGYIRNIEKKKDSIYKVYLYGHGRGSIEFVASGEHPILVSLPCNRGLIRGKIPKKGSHFGHKYHEHQRWITVKELFDKRYRFAYGRASDATAFHFDTISVGKELAKLFGYLMSDGTWSLNQSVKFTNVRDEVLQDVEKLAINFGLLTKRFRKGNGQDIVITHENGHNRFVSHQLLDSIVNLEIANHSDTFGKLQLLENAELVEFLKGYFNGDGSLEYILDDRPNHRPVAQMRFYTGINKRQAIELQFMLWRLGLYSTVKFRFRKNSVRGCWEVHVSPPSIKLAARLLKDIKYPETFDKVISMEDPPIENNLGTSHCCDINWMKIRKVEYLGETTVVGWESKPDHQIISYGGLVTHNSGKSYTVGVICEELCKNKVPFVIIDIEGEYSGLKEKYEAVWVGESRSCDLRWNNKVDLKLLAQYAPDCPPLILDLSEADRPREKVSQFLVAIYREISRRRTPYLVILEEADRFSPQSGERLPIFDEIARRGRKRGLGLMLCTQRPSLVDKNILSQCSNQLIGKLVIKNDLNSVAQFFPGHNFLNQLTTLSPGEFFALGGLAPEPSRVKMRPRETRHGGITPKLNPKAVRASVEKVLETIQSREGPHDLPYSAPARIVPARVIVKEGDEVQPPPQILSSRLQQEEEEGRVARPESYTRMIDNAEDLGKQYRRTIAPSAQIDLENVETEQDEDEALDKPQGPKILGLVPQLESEAVPALVKLEKSYRLFGQKENVARVDLAFRPLIEVAVRIRTGVLKKKFETRYFLLDGMTGKLASSSDRLNLREGIERFLGLEEGQIAILKALYPDKEQSLIEVAGAAKRTEEESRRLLKGLEDRRLVRSKKVGRAKMYRRLIDIPKIDLSGQSVLPQLSELNLMDGFKLSKQRIGEAQVREVVKGMWDGADVEYFSQFYYPTFRAELMLNGRSRRIWIDGRSGKELDI